MSDKYCLLLCSATMTTGADLQEMCHLSSSDHEYMVPVRSSRGKLLFLDHTAPFLFGGKRQFYGSVDQREYPSG